MTKNLNFMREKKVVELNKAAAQVARALDISKQVLSKLTLPKNLTLRKCYIRNGDCLFMI